MKLSYKLIFLFFMHTSISNCWSETGKIKFELYPFDSQTIVTSHQPKMVYPSLNEFHNFIDTPPKDSNKILNFNWSFEICYKDNSRYDYQGVNYQRDVVHMKIEIYKNKEKVDIGYKGRGIWSINKEDKCTKSRHTIELEDYNISFKSIPSFKFSAFMFYGLVPITASKLTYEIVYQKK